jgi:multidrug resistance efflux pump
MKFNFYYVLIFVLFTLMVVISFRYFRGSAYTTVGITYARQHTISTDKAATVTAIQVVPGQQVKAGDLLITLSSTEMEMDLDRLANRITALKSERAEKVKLTNSEIAYIRAQLDIELEEIESVITRTEGELELNRSLTTQTTGNPTEQPVTNPHEERVKSLRRQLEMRKEARSIRIRDVLQRHQLELQLMDNQISLLDREHELMLKEKTSLTKYAATDGVVDNVLAKKDEQVEAYAPLLSINPVNPTTVVGYMVGRKEVLPVGSEVVVKSGGHLPKEIRGKVIGYGSVVPLPEILQKSMAVKAFGRELFIEIPTDNNFAVGERVIIR